MQHGSSTEHIKVVWTTDTVKTYQVQVYYLWRKLLTSQTMLTHSYYKNKNNLIIDFLTNRTKYLIRRQAFASLQHGFLRSEENVVLYDFETPEGVWENVMSYNILIF